MKKLQWLMHLMGAIALLAPFLIHTTPRTSQAQGDEGQAYVIQHSDSLWKLAEKYLGDGNLFPLITQATAEQAGTDPSFTAISRPDLLHPGQKVWIPSAATLATSAAVGTETGTAAASVESAAVSRPAANGPNGHIAFSFWNNAPNRCTYEINVIDVSACLESAGACQATRRIYRLNNVSEPALSPDGRRLAFRGWGEIPDEFEGNPHPYRNCASPQAEHWIQTGTLDATDIRDATEFFEDAHPDWSPDGSRLLFDSGRNDDDITRILFIYADRSVDTAPKDDDGQKLGEEELHIAGQQPSWAPDNDRFVYRGCDQTGNRCGLWLARAVPIKSWEAGANVIGPILQEAEASHPDWSPVADEIVYQSPAGGSWDLYLIDAEGSNRRQLTTSPGLEGLPAWSPNGQWIAYVSHDGSTWSLRIVSRDGSEDHHLFTYDGGFYALPKAIDPYGGRDWLDEQISWSR